MENEDLINLNDWLTAEQAVERLSTNGIPVDIAQLYQRAAAAATRRKRISITSRVAFGRIVLLKSDVDRYGEALRLKRSTRSSKERRTQ